MSKKQMMILLTIAVTLAPVYWIWLVFWVGHLLGFGPGLLWWHFPYVITSMLGLFALLILAVLVWSVWDDRTF